MYNSNIKWSLSSFIISGILGTTSIIVYNCEKSTYQYDSNHETDDSKKTQTRYSPPLICSSIAFFVLSLVLPFVRSSHKKSPVPSLFIDDEFIFKQMTDHLLNVKNDIILLQTSQNAWFYLHINYIAVIETKEEKQILAGKTYDLLIDKINEFLSTLPTDNITISVESINDTYHDLKQQLIYSKSDTNSSINVKITSAIIGCFQAPDQNIEKNFIYDSNTILSQINCCLYKQSTDLPSNQAIDSFFELAN